MFTLKEKPRLIRRLIIISISVFFSALVLYDPSLFQFLEQSTLDLRFKMRGSLPADDNIAIVAIDENTFRDLAIWPLPRETMAALINKISAMKPKVIAVDILFSESRGGSKTRSAKKRLSSGDAALQRAIKRAGNVVLSTAFDIFVKEEETNSEIDTTDSLEGAAYSRIRKTDRFHSPIKASGALLPLAPLAKVAAALGHASILTDRDQVLRRELLSIFYQGEYYPPASLQAARLYLDLLPMDMSLRMGESVRLGEITIPTDEGGRMLINYLGPTHTFPHYSAIDILNNKLPSDTLNGKLVWLGVTALGSGELKESPFSAMQGVEKNAHAASTIISQRFLHRTEMMKLLDIALILIYGFILWMGLRKMNASGSAVMSVSLMAIHITAAILLFTRFGFWIYIVYPLGSIVVTYTAYTTYQYFTEERKARQIRKMFASYVSPRIVEEITKRPELAALGGRAEEVSILFSDIRGFTTYCERHTPAEVVHILNEYLGAMTDVTFYWEGTLDKFVGDAVMVYWGAPLPQKDHAERAVRCALQMYDKLEVLQRKWKAEGLESFDIGIGINTGNVIVGNIGADGKKMDYTVIGDAVNLAARAESMTRKLNVPIVIAEPTYLCIKDLLDTQLGETVPTKKTGHPSGRTGKNKIGRIVSTLFTNVEVKGKTEGVNLFGIDRIPRNESIIADGRTDLRDD